MRGRNAPGKEDRGMDISATARVEGWEMFMAGEREALVGRANGRLAHALRTTLPEESREELERLIEEDGRRAETARLDWLMGRTDRRLALLGVKLEPTR
jgi:hypothetical protein